MSTWILMVKIAETGTVSELGKTRATTRAAAVEAFVAGRAETLVGIGHLYPMPAMRGWDGLWGYAVRGGMYWLKPQPVRASEAQGATS
jgi:hypothetical protein